jgi:allophanate hydrolase subunit 2
VGGSYEAEAPLALALAGASMEARVRRVVGADRRLSVPQSFPMRPGERLVLGPVARGLRTYLAVSGGWRTAVVLGSRSSETRLVAGDRLPCEPGHTPVRHLAARAQEPADGPIRVIPGPDFKAFGADVPSLGEPHRVLPESDRVGLRLDGPAWAVAAEACRVSTPVAPGAIQAAGGRPLILGVACGTMGGYPHVLHVISADLDRVAQVRPGDRLRFALVTLEEARRLDRVARAAHRRACLRIATAAGDRPRPARD